MFLVELVFLTNCISPRLSDLITGLLCNLIYKSVNKFKMNFKSVNPNSSAKASDKQVLFFMSFINFDLKHTKLSFMNNKYPIEKFTL